MEKQLERALPKMAKAATDPTLKEGFMLHHKQTQEHSRRLEQIFKLLDLKPRKLKSEGMQGIIADSEWAVDTTGEPTLRDALLASLASYAEYYEMAGYQSASLQAKLLHLPEAEALLVQTLSEEEAANKTLTSALKKNLEAARVQDAS